MRAGRASFPLALTAAIVLVGAGAGLRAQEGLEMASAVPPGPLVYIEIRDFGGRLQQLLESEFARAFPGTRAFKDFTRTKLYNKLADRISELQEATGFGITLERAREIAGGRAALALYDIGELRFVLLTQIPPEKLAASALWTMRNSFEERRVHGVSYFVKEDPNGRVSLAFAAVGDILVAGTDINRFEASLGLLAGAGESLAGEEKFRAAFPPGFSLEDALIYLDQERIAETTYFRAYWIYGNLAELRHIKRVAINISIGEQGITETRWLSTDREPRPSFPDGMPRLARALPQEADLYFYSSVTGSAGFAGLLASELFEDADEGLSQGLHAALEPAVPQAYGLAVGSDFGEDRFFITVAKTVAITLGSPASLDGDALERALAGYYERKLLQAGQATFRFAGNGDLRALEVPLFNDSVPAYRLEGNVLIISNDAAALRAALQAGPNGGQADFVERSAGHSLLFRIDVRRAAEHLTEYFKIVSQRNNWRTSRNAAFFWRNVVSLLDSLTFLDSIIFKRGWVGGRMFERVEYLFRR